MADGKRTVGRPFKKGQSGNPGGQPKGLVRLIREKTQEGATLVAFMLQVFEGEHDAKLADRMAAATWLSDRGFGKPAQAIEVGLPDGTTLLPLAAVREVVGAADDSATVH